MWSTRLRIALALLVVVGAVVLASGGGASQRLAIADWKILPGPGRVTYDELIAYRATFETNSKSTLNKVKARITVPVAEGVEASPLPESHTCPSTPEIRQIADGPDEWACDFGTVVPGAKKLELTVVWKVPTLARQTICTGCLSTVARWTIKEGINDTTVPNDEFGKATLTATLLPKGEIPETSGETLLAGGYENAAASCTASSAGNLKTQGKLGVGNPIITKACLPEGVFPLEGQDRGYATVLTERAADAHHTDVCIAALGTDCVQGYKDENFFGNWNKKVITVVIQAFVPKNPAITSVSHNGVTMDADTCKNAGDCVLSITYDNQGKFYTIVLTSGTNGFYDF